MTEKILCNAEDLTAIADAVRASNGSTESYNVPELSAAAVNAIGSGAGEDVTAETETYTDLLTDLEAAVDALPDAGSGGGSVETCTVKFEHDDAWPGQIGSVDTIIAYCYTVEGGLYIVTTQFDYATLQIDNVVCGSFIYVSYSGDTEFIRAANAERLGTGGADPVFKINAPAGGEAILYSHSASIGEL